MHIIWHLAFYQHMLIGTDLLVNVLDFRTFRLSQKSPQVTPLPVKVIRKPSRRHGNIMRSEFFKCKHNWLSWWQTAHSEVRVMICFFFSYSSDSSVTKTAASRGFQEYSIKQDAPKYWWMNCTDDEWKLFICYTTYGLLWSWLNASAYLVISMGRKGFSLDTGNFVTSAA